MKTTTRAFSNFYLSNLANIGKKPFTYCIKMWCFSIRPENVQQCT